jgi:putative MATE family efflux protein
VMFVSQYWGKQELDGLRRIMGMTVTITVSLGVLVTLSTALFPAQCISLFSDDSEIIAYGAGYLRMVSISYLLLSLIYPINYMLRGMTRVQIVLYSAAVSVVINVVSNYILIFGHFGAPRLGVRGAALGTVATRASELAILLIYLVRSKNPILTEFHKMFTYTWTGFKSFLSKALPLAGNEFFWGMGTTLYFVVYGHMGKEALAAMSIMATMQTLVQTFGLSFSGSAAVIVGNEIGKGNREVIYLCAKRFHRLAIYVGASLTVIMLLLTKQIVRMYGISGTETGVYLTQCLYIMSSFLTLNTYNSMNVEGLFRSGGDVKTVLLMDMGGIWMIGLTLTFLFGDVLGLPVAIVYTAFVFVEIYKLIIGTVRYRSHKWLNSLELR